MNLWESFDQVYCLTMKDNTLRQESAKKNLAKVNIKNYQFFYGSSPEDEEIKDVYRNKQLIQFPLCFRCKKTECKCENNILIPSQIACFRSYMRIFETVLSSSFSGRTFLVVEDDIEFETYTKQLAERALNWNVLESHHFFSNLPVLLSMGQGYFGLAPKTSRLWREHYIWHEKDKTECNVMFGFNRAFAELAVRLFDRYEMTADTYIHRFLADNCIHYSLFPRIAHDLSWIGRLPSTIHPKKLYQREKHTREEKKVERQRFKSHIKHCETSEEYDNFIQSYLES